MPGHDRQVLGAVPPDDIVQTRDVFGEFGVVTARVDEQPAVPVDQPKLGETELGGLEAVDVLEAGRIAQPAVEPVRPRVVRADDAAPLGRCPARQQLVAAVPAGIRERANGAVLAAHQQHRVGARTDGSLRADGGEVGGVAHAGPSREDGALLPFEDLGVHVRLARQHARLAERRQGRGKVFGGNGCWSKLFEHTVRLVGGTSAV